MVITMVEACATSEQEHLHLYTGGNESPARYVIIIIIIIIIIIRCIHEDSSYEQLCVSESC
jgi:hypothetical protein